MQRPQRLEKRAWSRPSDSTLAKLAPAGQAGRSWPGCSSGSFPFFWVTPPVFLLPHLCLGRLPTAGTGDTTSSLASGSLATPVEGPAEPYADRTPPETSWPLTVSLSPGQPRSFWWQRRCHRVQLQALLLPQGGIYKPQLRHMCKGWAGQVSQSLPIQARGFRKWASVCRPSFQEQVWVLWVRMDTGPQLWLVF